MNNNLIDITKKRKPKNTFKMDGNESPNNPTVIIDKLNNINKNILNFSINFSLII